MPDTRVLPYEFSRGSADKKENSWECIGRLADEVAWRRFVRAGALWYVSEQWLQDQRSPFPPLRSSTPGVVNLSFDFETRMDATEASMTVQAERLTILPGDLIHVEGEGPGNGKWLVNSTRRSLHSQNVEVALKRPQPKLEEPAPEVQTVSVAGGATGGLPSGGLGGLSFDVNFPEAGGATGDLARVRLDSRWGGCQAVFEQYITPFLARFGLRAGSQKRNSAAVRGSSGTSDHDYSQKTAYATDYPTGNGNGAASALSRAIGNGGYVMNTYSSGHIVAGGGRFRIQILFGPAIAHSDHIHCGLRRMG